MKKSTFFLMALAVLAGLLCSWLVSQRRIDPTAVMVIAFGGAIVGSAVASLVKSRRMLARAQELMEFCDERNWQFAARVRFQELSSVSEFFNAGNFPSTVARNLVLGELAGFEFAMFDYEKRIAAGEGSHLIYVTGILFHHVPQALPFFLLLPQASQCSTDNEISRHYQLCTSNGKELPDASRVMSQEMIEYFGNNHGWRIQAYRDSLFVSRERLERAEDSLSFLSRAIEVRDILTQAFANRASPDDG